jgi:hypothetical protein
MKMVKSLILGSAAGLVAMSGAQAADLPVKAKAVEYVRICSLYGAGFYYIPGTDTCIKLGGYLRVDMYVNANSIGSGNTQVANNQPGGFGDRFTNAFTWRSREDLNIDTRTATEYGVVRTFFDAVFQWTDDNYTANPNNGLGSSYGLVGQGGGTSALVQAYNGSQGLNSYGTVGVNYAYMQFAGFTIGKALSAFSAPWAMYPGNNYDGLVGGGGAFTGVSQFTYTAQFGNGVSGTVSVQDPTIYYQAGVLNYGAFGSSVATNGTGISDYAGTAAPDIVGNIQVTQAWGMAQLSVAAHDNNVAYYCNNNTAPCTAATNNIQGGHPDDKWGFAVQGALTLNNIPTGLGDTINVSGVYTNGATRYNIQDLASQTGAWSSFSGGTSLFAGGPTLGKVGYGIAPDAVFNSPNSATGGQLNLISTWGMRGAFNHNWDPYWSTSIYGAYAYVDYGGNAKAVFCANFTASTNAFNPVTGFGVSSCNPNYSIAQLGTVTRWTPVKNLTFSSEFIYSHLDQNNVGTIQGLSGSYGTGSYQLADQNTYQVLLRAQRNF